MFDFVVHTFEWFSSFQKFQLIDTSIVFSFRKIAIFQSLTVLVGPKLIHMG